MVQPLVVGEQMAPSMMRPSAVAIVRLSPCSPVNSAAVSDPNVWCPLSSAPVAFLAGPCAWPGRWAEHSLGRESPPSLHTYALPACTEAVIKDGDEECLGFAGSRARDHEWGAAATITVGQTRNATAWWEYGVKPAEEQSNGLMARRGDGLNGIPVRRNGPLNMPSCSSPEAPTGQPARQRRQAQR